MNTTFQVSSSTKCCNDELFQDYAYNCRLFSKIFQVSSCFLMILASKFSHVLARDLLSSHFLMVLLLSKIYRFFFLAPGSLALEFLFCQH